MIEQKPLTVSVVVPCYNEEDNIANCLKSLESQTVKPFEIIVVDNNCTDKTAKIARLHGARVIKEKKQGLIAARNAGMAVARGEVIARIDADSRPADNWVATINRLMQEEGLQAVTGSGYFYDLPFKKPSKFLRNLVAIYLNRLFLGHDMLWGSNMAIRTAAWHQIKTEVCNQSDIMEDLDIAMHLADEFGLGAIHYNSKMRVDISVRRATGGLLQHYLYLRMWPKTLKNHRTLGSLGAWPVVGFLMLTYAPFTTALSRFHNGEKWVFDFDQIRGKNSYDRDNP
ncbi:MAG TPA: glycosyltransferase family 2 protein [Candidatus Saccharimonadales bacterium]|nr:glycosyltransferase family 2 protein [Candidatus Saccharimonadales bacterium]